jgi:hypothetical protein
MFRFFRFGMSSILLLPRALTILGQVDGVVADRTGFQLRAGGGFFPALLLLCVQLSMMMQSLQRWLAFSKILK